MTWRFLFMWILHLWKFNHIYPQFYNHDGDDDAVRSDGDHEKHTEHFQRLEESITGPLRWV